VTDDPQDFTDTDSREDFSDTAKRVSSALERCFLELAGPDGAPKNIPKPGGYYTKIDCTPRPSLDKEAYRLVSWLNTLADREEHLAYAALRQIWLEIHGARRPKGVFKHHLDSRGRGGNSKYDQTFVNLSPDEMEDLKKGGMSWRDIAVKEGLVSTLKA